MSLKGKVCVITGSSGRIGRAFVDRFLNEGATVVAVDLIPLEGYEVDNQTCDLGSTESISELERYLTEQYGSVDCLVNNGALGGARKSVLENEPGDFDKMMAVNVKGPMLLSQACIRLHQSRSKSGSAKTNPRAGLSIINITSIAAHSPVARSSLYSMSKAALMSLTKSVAKEYGRDGVRCNSVSPGYMMVPNIQGIQDEELAKAHEACPIGRGGEPDEVAGIVAWLASDESSYTSGADFLIDGGLLA